MGPGWDQVEMQALHLHPCGSAFISIAVKGAPAPLRLSSPHFPLPAPLAPLGWPHSARAEGGRPAAPPQRRAGPEGGFHFPMTFLVIADKNLSPEHKVPVRMRLWGKAS